MKVLFAGPDRDLAMKTSGDDRKKGLHLSDITKRMAYEKDKKLNPNNPIDAMVLERGFTWERVLEIALASRHERPGHRPEQIQEDTIWMSPDWLNTEDDPIIEEWKCTKKSLKQGFEGVSWHWLPNAMSYLRAALKRKWVRQSIIRFRLWWMNGDYSYESKSSDYLLLNDYWKVDVEFSKRELEENWQAILASGRRYGLLKEEDKWDSRKTPPTEEAPASKRKAVSPVPPTSRKPGRVVMFPTTKNRARSNNA